MKRGEKRPYKCGSPHRWTEAEHKYIVRYIRGRSYQKLAELVSNRFGWDCKYYHIRRFVQTHGITPGHESGRRRTTPIGTLALWTDCGRKTWYEKVGKGVPGADEDGWKKKHIVEWEKVHGPVPDGMCLMFADGNTENWHVENLTLATFSQRSGRLMLKRYKGIQSYDKASSEALNTLADLTTELNKIKGRYRKR